MAIVFAEIGQDVHLTGGSFEDAVTEGVRRGYIDGYLRLSVVGDPLRRENTNDNTPCILYTSVVPGDKVKITVAPKGFGSETVSYTHLDVYKRQPEDRPGGCRRKDLQQVCQPLCGDGASGDCRRQKAG